MNASPLTDAQRDALIRTLTRQCTEAQAERDTAYATIRRLSEELVEVHRELATYKAGRDEKGMPF